MPAGSNSGKADQLLPLLHSVRDGDQDAFATLYDRTSPRLFGVAMTILNNAADAEDVLSEVFQQVWRTAGRYEVRRGSVLTWMIVICRSRALDSIRRRRPGDESAIPDLAVNDTALRELENADISSEALADALRQLSEEQRQLLALAFFRGLTHQEIAATTRIPLGTVKSHIRRGLLLMREHLQGN